jgi:hypothetical protein
LISRSQDVGHPEPREVGAELDAHELPRKVILCTYDALATAITTEALEAFGSQPVR